MPFINSKVSIAMTQQQKDTIKEKLGEAIQLLGKSESWLMVGFDDQYCLYFKGEQSEKIAMVEVALFGKASLNAYDQFTAKVCDIFKEVLQIPGDKVYIKYEEVDHWGYNGTNF